MLLLLLLGFKDDFVFVFNEDADIRVSVNVVNDVVVAGHAVFLLIMLLLLLLLLLLLMLL